MILKIAGINSEIDFKNFINVLEIQNKGMYRNIIMKLNSSINNKDEESEIIIVENEEKLDMNKVAQIVIDPFNVEFNSKEVLSKLYLRVEQLNLLESATNSKYEKVTLELLNYIRELLLDLPFDCNMNEKIGVKDLLKILSVKIDTIQYETLEDKIMFLMDLINEFELCNILILVGIKQYFDTEKLNVLYKYAISKEIRLLLLENVETEKLDLENKIIIDEDFVDFIV